MNKNGLAGLAIAVAAGFALSWWMRSAPPAQRTDDIRSPVELSGTARAGQKLFDANCSACHGKNAAGTDNGPPLVHILYEPNHHGAGAFYRAAKYGVQSHHWSFGNMPPIVSVTKPDVTSIIAYVRALQVANGIE